jgi:hypothetical protein
MTKWTVGDTAHHRQAGIFDMVAWPIKADEKTCKVFRLSKQASYSSWAAIPSDGDSNILPSSVRARREFATLDEAKAWIEGEVRRVCQTAIDELEK